MLWCLTLVSAIVGGIGYFVSKGDVVAASALGVIGMAGMVGYRIRISGFLSFVTGLVVGGIYAPECGTVIGPTVTDVLHASPEISRLASVSLAGMFLTLITTTFMRSISRLLCRPASMLDHSDCMGGFAIGSIQGVGMAVALIGSILAFEPLARKQLDTGSALASLGNARNVLQGIGMLAGKTRASAVFPLVERIDPFEWVPRLKQFKQALRESDGADLTGLLVQVVSSTPTSSSPAGGEAPIPRYPNGLDPAIGLPSSIDRDILSHPAIAKLNDDPALRRQLMQLLESYGNTRR